MHEQLVTQKIVYPDFWCTYRSFTSSGKSLDPPLFNGAEVITSSADKAELFAKMFCENSTLDDSYQDKPDFPSRADSQLSKLRISVKKVSVIIASLDTSKASGPNGIPVIGLKRGYPDFSPSLP